MLVATYSFKFGFFRFIRIVIQIGAEVSGFWFVATSTTEMGTAATLTACRIALIVNGATQIAIAWFASFRTVAETPVFWLKAQTDPCTVKESEISALSYQATIAVLSSDQTLARAFAGSLIASLVANSTEQITGAS